jgi:hypothetical protein
MIGVGVESFLTNAYDCEWCVPYQLNVGPVTHYELGDERYAEHWYSRIAKRHRLVLMHVLDGVLPKTTESPGS